MAGLVGSRGSWCSGTNGEGPPVALAEKRRVLEYLFGRGLSCQIVPAVMEGNLPETLELVRTIAELPAAVLVLPPYYFKPLHEEGLHRFLEPVLATARQPVILYHIPKYAVAVPASLVSALDVWGVKDSGGVNPATLKQSGPPGRACS